MVWEEYFQWMLSKINLGSFTNDYRYLLNQLNQIQYRWIYDLDESRYLDGLALRKWFAYEKGIPQDIVVTSLKDIPCTFLEFMVALSLKMEQEIFLDPEKGDRTAVWFWKMIRTLGCFSYPNWMYNQNDINTIISNYLSLNYQPNGQGGLFLTRQNIDMRSQPVWYQVSIYSSEQDVYDEQLL